MTLKQIMQKGKYFRELADRYNKFFNPQYSSQELDLANEIITKASYELKKLFSIQCEPCQLDPLTCEGNIDKAKKWKCTEFFNGFTVIEK